MCDVCDDLSVPVPTLLVTITNTMPVYIANVIKDVDVLDIEFIVFSRVVPQE